MHECAIFPLSAFLGPLPVIEGRDNAPRRLSEATMTSYGPKYRKFGAVGFYGGFTVFFHGFAAGIVKTSDFFEAKFRCFASKVRRFMPKKSDVFAKKVRISRLFCRFFDLFCCKNGGEVPNIA